MAAIPADPLVLTSIIFSFDDPDAPGTALEYECHVHSVELASEAEVISYQTLCESGSFSALGRETFTLNVTAAQDWSADGFTRFLWEHSGQESEVTFGPHGAAPSADTPHFIATVTIPRPSVGGEVSTFAESELVFPVKGTPELAVA